MKALAKRILKIVFFWMSRIPLEPLYKKGPREIILFFLDSIFKPGKIVRIRWGVNRGLFWRVPVCLDKEYTAVGDDRWILHQVHLGIHELKVQKALKRIIRPGFICYDIGANMGFFTLLMAKAAGQEGRVEAFEPIERNADSIVEAVSMNNFHNVRVHRKAVSSRSGMIDFLVHNDMTISQIAECGPVYNEARRNMAIIAQTLHPRDKDAWLDEQLTLISDGRLDSVVTVVEKDIEAQSALNKKVRDRIEGVLLFLNKNRKRYRFHTAQIESISIDDAVGKTLKPPDIVKIDVEGAEGLVLEGMRQTLLSYHPILYVELHTEPSSAATYKIVSEVGGYDIYSTDFKRIIKNDATGIVCMPRKR